MAIDDVIDYVRVSINALIMESIELVLANKDIGVFVTCACSPRKELVV